MLSAVIQGDCRASMAAMPDACIDALVSDPPYELGFMGKRWDASGIAFDTGLWREVLRVMKPGAHLLAFSGTRTYHRMVCAIEDAGFEIRDQLAWLYGTGFPKSLDVSKAIDAAAGAEREIVGRLAIPGAQLQEMSGGGKGDNKWTGIEYGGPATAAAAAAWSGWGTALKPAQEPIVLARKPLIGTVAANVLAHGTGGINVDACRIGSDERYNPPVVKGWQPDGTYTGRDAEGSNVVGRWPANVLFDEAAAAMLDEQSGYQKTGTTVRRNGPISGGVTSINRPKPQGPDVEAREEGGGASRFFYVAKASRAERERGLDHLSKVRRTDGRKSEHHVPNLRTTERRNHHPTVKPIELMRYLVRLITPPGGIVLDPFAGSGTTGIACKLEGVSFVGCELSPEYVEIANARIKAA